MDGKGASFSHIALHLDFSFVVLGDVLDNGKSQAGASGLSASGSVHPVKSVEYFVQVFAADTRTSVSHGNDGVTVAFECGYPDRSALRAVFYCIVQQVHHCLFQKQRICGGLDWNGQFGRNTDVPARIVVPADMERFFNDPFQIRRLQPDIFSLHSFQLGKREKVVDQGDHPVHIFFDDIEKVLIFFRIAFSIHGLQCFNESLDGGERGFQLVGDIGGECFLHVLKFFDPGDVVEYDQCPDPGPGVVMQGGGVDVEDIFFPPVDQHVFFHGMAGGQGGLDKFLEFVVSGRFKDMFSFEYGRRKIEDPSGGLVHGNDSFILVDCDHPFPHA